MPSGENAGSYLSPSDSILGPAMWPWQPAVSVVSLPFTPILSSWDSSVVCPPIPPRHSVRRPMPSELRSKSAQIDKDCYLLCAT